MERKGRGWGGDWFLNILFLNAWARTRERVLPINAKPVPIGQTLKSLNQRPWYILMVVLIVVNLASTMKNQSTIYYMQYNVGRPELTSAMLTVPNLLMIIALLFSPLITKKMGKRNASLGGALGAGVLALGSYVPNVVQSASSLAAIRFNFIWAARTP